MDSRLSTRVFLPLLLTFFPGALLAQLPSCLFTSTATIVHAEGLAEPVGGISLNCSGGTVGNTVSLIVYVILNTNVTNRLDVNSKPTGITVTGASSVGSINLASSTALVLNTVNFVVAATPTTIAINGILAAVAPLVAVSSPASITASVTGIGATFPGAQTLLLALSAPSLLSSVIKYGVPCGNTLPATLDFPTFTSATLGSTVRVTEASPVAFTSKIAGADNGLRILVNLTGYGTTTRIFVPDAIVGNDGSAATTIGQFSGGTNGGTYTPGGGQLLLIRVNGADSNGAGGTLARSKPTVATGFSTVSELTVSNGTASVAYEVVDSNPQYQESAQIPVFPVTTATVCSTTAPTPVVAAELAPVSQVSIATMADPLPRFVPVIPAIDCNVLNDCNALYYPTLTVNTTAISLSGSSQGAPQSAFVAVGNTGSGILGFTTSIAYPAGSSTGWLSVSPSSGANNVTLQVIADPTTLQPGTYTASVTVSSGGYGSGVIPVTFTVGAVGVTVLNVGNAASFQYGTVAPGSYAVLYGLNLVSGSTPPAVTFNGLAAAVVYSSATQINLIVPSALSGQQAAAVVVSVNGLVSNSFRVALAANAPGIFTPGIVNVSDGSVNSASHPAAAGSYVSIYLTGLSASVANATVNIGTLGGLVPQFAGAQPTLPALDQVNILVPASLAGAGALPVTVCIGPLTCSNQVSLYVH